MDSTGSRRTLGPRVTFTASARRSTPMSIFALASFPKMMSLPEAIDRAEAGAAERLATWRAILDAFLRIKVCIVEEDRSSRYLSSKMHLPSLETCSRWGESQGISFLRRHMKIGDARLDAGSLSSSVKVATGGRGVNDFPRAGDAGLYLTRPQGVSMQHATA